MYFKMCWILGEESVSWREVTFGFLVRSLEFEGVKLVFWCEGFYALVYGLFIAQSPPLPM